jgi:hypothetical protein
VGAFPAITVNQWGCKRMKNFAQCPNAENMFNTFMGDWGSGSDGLTDCVAQKKEPKNGYISSSVSLIWLL